MEQNGISEKLHKILGLSLEEKTTGNHSDFARLRCLSLTLTQHKLFPFSSLSLSQFSLFLFTARALSLNRCQRAGSS